MSTAEVDSTPSAVSLANFGRRKGVDDSWKKIQERVFKNWMNDRLRGNLKVAQMQVKDMQTDLQDGLLLVDLLNRLHPKAIERYNKRPTGKLHCIENLGLALKFCTNQNIKLVNIGPEDIHGGNLKLILGLIWTLIGKYQIKSSGRGLSTKKAMMGWIATVVPEYRISNFNTDWNDGRALCGMVDRIRPGLSPNHYALDKTHGLDNCRLGMDLAEQHLDIPKVLSPEDLNNPEVDDLSVMTYLSYFCNPANAQLLQWIRKKIPQQNIKNLKTDWNTGINLAALTEACFPGVCPDWEKMEPANGLQNNEKMIALIKERLGLECMVSAAEISDPKVDEIVVATYLSQLRNAKLRASPEEFSLSIAPLPGGCAIIQEPVTFEVEVTEQAAELANDIHINAHGPSSDVAVSIKPKKDNPNLVATFIPMEAGSYDILASYNGQNIQGSPFQLMVADPSKCLFLGDPPSTLQVGQTEEVVVKTQGAGEGKMACTIEAAGQSATPVLSSSLEDQGSNTYGITLNPKSIGEATISVTWAGHPVPRSPFHVTICDASKCSMEGLEDAELVVGKPVTFTVSSAGAGDGKFEVKPQGPSALYSPNITDKGNGKQEVSFTPWEVGAHEVEVLWGGAQIPKSPVSLSVHAAPDVTACSATGQGLKNGIVGKPNAFKILSPEKDLLSKPDGLAITVTSVNEEAPVEIKDNGDATYTVMYTPPAAGTYVASINFYGKPIPGSPFKIEVVPAPDASKCRAYGPALHPNSLHIAGTPLDLFVDTKTAGTGELQVAVKGPDNSLLKVFQANDSGLHSLKFDVPTAGRYYIHVWWSRTPIPGSPFKIKVHPGPIAGNVVAYGPGLEPTVKVGDKGEFTIETKNAGIGTLTIRVHGVKGKFKIEASPESESNSRTLKAHFDPKEGGDYIIAIRWSGIHIPNSPFNIHILDEEEEKRKKSKTGKGKKKEEEHDEEDKEEEEDQKTKPQPTNEVDGIETEGVGVRKMTKEEVRAYQQQQLSEKRLQEAGYPPQHLNPAYLASGGAVGMHKKYKANPSMSPGTFVPGGQVVEVTKTTISKKVEKKSSKKGRKI